MRRLVIGTALFVMGSRSAHAQLVVHDAATTARNAITAAVKERLVATQELQHERLRRMAARLSLYTSLAKFAPPDTPLWRTAGPIRSIYAEAYNEALVSGDPSGSAYLELAHGLMAAHAVLAHLDPAARRTLASRLATVDATDAAIVAATNGVGSLRAHGRDHERRAIAALESHVTDPSAVQSTTAVLDKIAGAGLLAARQRQARVQLLTAVVEQMLLDGKRARDTEATALNAQLATWDSASVVNQAFVEGTADALRTWRQP